MSGRYFAKGKLLISGEYLVLKDAQALVLPLESGQWMHIRTTDPGKSIMHWQANEYGSPWFSATIDTFAWTIAETTDRATAERLIALLKAVRSLNAEILKPGSGYVVTTDTTFNMSWGLGSSSALIANLAHWARVDPFELFLKVSSGSGFDVAAASAYGPFIYRLQKSGPEIKPVQFLPEFRSCIWFVYRGNKKNSAEGVTEFMHRASIRPWHVKTMDRLTQAFLKAGTVDEFIRAVNAHEVLIGRLLNQKPVQEELFFDFEGTVKSLGAWGGDFMMAVSEGSSNYVMEYFRRKGLTTIFSFDEMANSHVLKKTPA